MSGNELITKNLEIIEMMTQDGASPPLDEYWEPIVDVLSKDIGTTKDLLLNCTTHEIWLMGGYFEDVSYNLQSQEFIDFLRELQQKYPQIDIEKGIQWAIDAILD
ncbi:hypothetical protein [Paenibacillus sinopodophylli]|uniref:hypothetical protein n=1 Tax=Paenibacillus sinopodophylli TaxID=1837342 RepID=UPI00110CD299|nr:hypothetical protein [Paenibacillus sinopodophylli]